LAHHSLNISCFSELLTMTSDAFVFQGCWWFLILCSDVSQSRRPVREDVWAGEAAQWL